MAGSNGRLDGQKNYTESAETAAVTEGSGELRGSRREYAAGEWEFNIRVAIQEIQTEALLRGESGGLRMVLRCQKER